MVGTNLIDGFIPPSHKKDISNALQEAFISGRRATISFPIRGTDQRIVLLTFEVDPVRNSEGSIIALLGHGDLIKSIIHCSGRQVDPNPALASEPLHAMNWDKAQLGMKQNEIKEILGTPDKITNQSRTKGRDFAGKVIAPILDGLIFGFWAERWEYGGHGLLLASDKAYIVYFDRHGKLIDCREPRVTSDDLK